MKKLKFLSKITFIVIILTINIKCPVNPEIEEMADITIKISNATPNAGISMTLIDETTKQMKSNYTYDYSKGIKTDSNGSYTTELTSLPNDHSYSVVVRIDSNKDELFDGNDTGFLVFSKSPKVTLNFSIFLPLRTMSINSAPTEISLANETVICAVSTFDYLIEDYNITNLAFVDIMVVQYDTVGNPSPFYSAYIPKNYLDTKYGNIYCIIDSNANDLLDNGEKYQLIPWSSDLTVNLDNPILIDIPSWETY